MNLKKLLKEQGAAVLPDERVKEGIRAELGYTANDNIVPAGGGAAKVRNVRNIKTVAAITAAAVAVCAVGVTLGVVLSSEKVTLPDTGLSIDDGKFEEITSSGEFYAYGAASIGALLSAGQQTLSAVSAKSIIYTSARATSVDFNELDGYMSLVEGLLSEGDIKGVEGAGSGGYAYSMTITCPNLSGGASTYVMNYNKIFRGSEEDGDEREEYYSISGELVVEGVSYEVEGDYTSESEPDEEEHELFFRAYTSKSSYIEVERESENEEDESEIEYVYSRYSSGERTERTTVKYESEEGETSICIEIERGGQKDELHLRPASGQDGLILSARGRLNGENVRFYVYRDGGGYRYVF